MLNDAREVFQNAINAYPWVSSLANILPLSALLDFIDIPRTLHAFELNGATPLWCWPITPAGSRAILYASTTEDPCCLDKFGSSASLVCLDGRWGDVYNAASPETLRLCLATAPVVRIANDDLQMKRDGARMQKLTVVHVSRLARESERPQRPHSWSFVGASVMGWILLVGLIVFTGLMHCWLSLAFLLVVPATGAAVSLTRGGKPRELRPVTPGRYDRIVVAALHMNETEWFVFYGETKLVNSLLSHQLRSRRFLDTHNWVSHTALRALILGQWALVVGAAALQAWDAYFITFWIVFCILSHTLVFPPERCAKDWAERAARVRFERFETLLSGRRPLLNTIMALNPETFPRDPVTGLENHEKLYEGGLLWIDPILKPGADRSRWEEATRRAMVAVKNQSFTGKGDGDITVDGLEDRNWAKDYQESYWRNSIVEGMVVAKKIVEQAGLGLRADRTFYNKAV
ncbi:hypothetical protein F4802DRAFT_574569 [Xylaria palmicola]|nr:hypothetical protein F4802DRAFT_574569 [Xylaria palmicola]